MDKENILAPLGIIVAAVVSVVSGPGAFDLWDLVVGIVLLLILFEYKGNIENPRPYKVLLSTCFGFCAVLIFGVFVELLFSLKPFLVFQIASIRSLDLTLIVLGLFSSLIYYIAAFKKRGYKGSRENRRL